MANSHVMPITGQSISASAAPHPGLKFVLGALILLVAWQFRKTQSVITGIMIILIVGILLRYYPTIKNQFHSIGV